MENLDYKISNITGDVLVASGFVAYLGPFTVSEQCFPQGSVSSSALLAPCCHWPDPLGERIPPGSLHLCQRLHRVSFERKQEGLYAHSRLAATKRKAVIVLLMAGSLPRSAVQRVAEAAVRKQHSSHQGAKPHQHPWRPCGNPLLAGKLQKNPTLQAEGASGKG